MTQVKDLRPHVEANRRTVRALKFQVKASTCRSTQARCLWTPRSTPKGCTSSRQTTLQKCAADQEQPPGNLHSLWDGLFGRRFNEGDVRRRRLEIVDNEKLLLNSKAMTKSKILQSPVWICDEHVWGIMDLRIAQDGASSNYQDTSACVKVLNSSISNA